MMKTNKVFRLVTVGLFVAVLVIGTASSFKTEKSDSMFDGFEHREYGYENKMDFTDAQKAQMKMLKLSFMKEITPIKNEMEIKVATFNAASIGDNVNVKKVNNLIEEIGALKIEMSKKQFAHKQSVRNLLSDEQKIMFDAHSGMRHMEGKEKGMKREGEKGGMHNRYNREMIKDKSSEE